MTLQALLVAAGAACAACAALCALWWLGRGDDHDRGYTEGYHAGLRAGYERGLGLAYDRPSAPASRPSRPLPDASHVGGQGGEPTVSASPAQLADRIDADLERMRHSSRKGAKT